VFPIKPINGVSNYFQGSPDRWRTGVQHYSRVHARNLYPGGDRDYYFQNSQFEFDVHVRPAANAAAPPFAVRGAQSFDVQPDSALRLRLAGSKYCLREPLAYQTEDGVRRPVDCRSAVDAKGNVSFARTCMTPAAS
jgi:hypothetical protein